MSVRGKVAAVAAPEVAAVAHRKRPPAADPRVSAPGSKAARDRAAIEAIKDKRPAGPSSEGPKPATADDDAPAPASTSPAPSSPSSGGRGLDAVHTGGGFLLGLAGWVVFVNYMQGGTDQVRRLAAAKFLNRTTGATK